MKNVELKRDTETIKVAEDKVQLYRSCGWTVVNELFTFENKDDENEAWLERFGD